MMMMTKAAASNESPKRSSEETTSARRQNEITAMKLISLVILLIQNASLILSVRHVWMLAGDHFLATSAIVMVEMVKVMTCLFIIMMQKTVETSSYGIAWVGRTVLL